MCRLLIMNFEQCYLVENMYEADFETRQLFGLFLCAGRKSSDVDVKSNPTIYFRKIF